jgi:hypothetical protein
VGKELKAIYIPKNESVTAEWRKLHKEKLHYFILRQILLELTDKGRDGRGM